MLMEEETEEGRRVKKLWFVCLLDMALSANYYVLPPITYTCSTASYDTTQDEPGDTSKIATST